MVLVNCAWVCVQDVWMERSWELIPSTGSRQSHALRLSGDRFTNREPSPENDALPDRSPQAAANPV